MEYRNLGKSGVKVSKVCLGTAFRGQEDDKDQPGKSVPACHGRSPPGAIEGRRPGPQSRAGANDK